MVSPGFMTAIFWSFDGLRALTTAFVWFPVPETRESSMGELESLSG